VQGPAEGRLIEVIKDLAFYLVDNQFKTSHWERLSCTPLGAMVEARCYDVKGAFLLSAEFARKTIGGVSRALRCYSALPCNH
jgi:hypothetical protein